LNNTLELTTDDIIAIQANLLARMNAPDSPPLRRGDLDSAVQRYRNAAAYEGADLIRQAVILATSLSQAQAFLDGNKRVGFAAADIFLRINGLLFSGPPLEMARWIEVVAEANREDRTAAIEEFGKWLRLHICKQ